jgi:aspartyl-tRNA(Asn)/glutamyl-tRNA(Gln) amidotransferase subunit A
MEQSLKQKIQDIKKGKLKAVNNVLQFSEKIATPKSKKQNIFLHLNPLALEQAKEIDKRIKNKKQVGKLAGLCYSVKSNICVQGLTANCASKVLENFTAPFDATVIKKLKAEDAICIGMVNMDEFACGASGETSAFGPTLNPKNEKIIPGGTSSGSAASVAAELCDFSLGSETGGSIRNPASHCGVVGLKPSYGSVSRYGLIDMTMSFDQIGTLTHKAEDAKLIFDIIKGQDNFDPTSLNATKIKEKKTLTIGLVDVQDFCDKEISEIITKKTEELAKKHKFKIKKVNLPLDIAIQTYYLIVYTEFFSATRKFDGRRFGFKIEDKAGPEVLRRILGGEEIAQAEYAGKYYRNALKAQQYVKEQFNKLFKDCDILILPTVPRLAHNLGEKISIKDMYNYDVTTALANIAGICGISVPVGEIDKKPLGLQIMAPRFHEDLLFQVGKKVE